MTIAGQERDAVPETVLQRQEPLGQQFFARPVLLVARELLGKILVRQIDGVTLAGRIVETEAYAADIDESCHAYRRQTPRNRSMFGPAGHAYVYRSYGIHYCLNIVTTLRDGPAAAVLIRALEPVSGLAMMRERRAGSTEHRMLSGPGNLCRAMCIDLQLDGTCLTPPALWISVGPHVSSIVTATRIGISRSTDLPWRFYVPDSRAVSRQDRAAEQRLAANNEQP